MGSGLASVAFVGRVVCFFGWHASLDAMSGVLTWMASFIVIIEILS